MENRGGQEFIESWLYSELGDCLSTRRGLLDGILGHRSCPRSKVCIHRPKTKHRPLHILNPLHHVNPTIPFTLPQRASNHYSNSARPRPPDPYRHPHSTPPAPPSPCSPAPSSPRGSTWPPRPRARAPSPSPAPQC